MTLLSPGTEEIFKNILLFLESILKPIIGFLEIWWWFFLPFVLIRPFLFLWKWWRNEIWLMTVFKPILLEVKMPKDVLKPIRAMEDVMASLHGVIYHPPDWWEKWIDGQLQTSITFEMISDGGDIHFFIRIHEPYRQAVESSIYAQFPQAELVQAKDYTKLVPQDIPNKDWDLFAADYKTMKDDHYPIKTYMQFETEQEALEEKRIDPLSSLLEAMAKIKPGEQIWFQYMAEPTSNEPGQVAPKWLQKGEELRDELAKRPEKPKLQPMAVEAVKILITGKPTVVEEEEQPFLPPEMKLTPGEKEVITAVEKKMSKSIFNTSVRFIYLGKTDVWFKPNFRLAFSFFNQYTTQNLNAIQPIGKTLTKIHKHWFLPVNIFLPRRSYLRRRKIFRNYIIRLSAFFPRPGGTFMLNTEELASLFHFPSWIVSPVPGVLRVEAKKGPPPELPFE